jgi:Asp-tRNA(Asn)/Glu-tRNA(Gln) amidotransferase A subunit family amidase
LLNPYKSVVKVLEVENKDDYLVGIKNTSSIPNTLMKKLQPHGFSLHTVDKKSQLAGRAVDIELINPVTGNYMSGSSSGTAINVFAGINDLGIGNDGGGSVLAPAMCVNIYGFISRLLEKDRKEEKKENTDGIIAGNSLGFFAREVKILYKAIKAATGLQSAEEYGRVFSDKVYHGVDSEVIAIMDSSSPRNKLTEYLKEILAECDVFMVTEGPIDLYGFGDSLFGHYDERTRAIQKQANKGFVRVCNIADATAMAIPQNELGVAILLMCESTEEKVVKLLKLGECFKQYRNELIERYFLDLDNYFDEGYQI